MTVNAVLIKADVTKGALYYHFASKEALVDAVVDQAHRAWLSATESLDGPSSAH